MSKAKLTIENTELEKFQSCVQLAGMKVLEVKNLGTLNQVLTYYKTEQQLIMCGRYMEKMVDPPALMEIPLKKTSNPKKKSKS